MGEIVDHAEMGKRVSLAKSRGETVVFVNGAFDILHVGHIRYLQGAAILGDLLVCAVNSDDSVRGLKGENRPVQTLADRMEIVAALECVDFVTSFNEPKVDRLLLELKPDIHAKGTDYTEDSVPEADVVRSYGGRIAITGDPKDHNTSDIIQSIRKREKEHNS